jgi:hypothetical protein
VKTESDRRFQFDVCPYAGKTDKDKFPCFKRLAGNKHHLLFDFLQGGVQNCADRFERDETYLVRIILHFKLMNVRLVLRNMLSLESRD